MTKRSKMLKVLRPAEFRSAAAKFPGLSENGVAVARAVLVDGEDLAAVAERFGIHRSQAHQWAAKVFDGHRPRGWVTETVSLPEAAMHKVREMVRIERDRWEAAAGQNG